ncbi:MAG TPA: L,D-transpeptidase [Chthoniobacteraceae bacterium]|nr:L,D-transpeptidase [Chthoniobacteraceae bacterium]
MTFRPVVSRLVAIVIGASSFGMAPSLFAAPGGGVAEVLISVAEQRLKVLYNGTAVASYPISTSRFGLGDAPRSYKTPLGAFSICSKVGDNLPLGAVLKGRRFTGEVLAPNAPGRDPIVTRILRLEGLEPQNRRAFQRGIYIHGTPEERNIGRPVSYGCIRMRSRDVVELYKQIPVGTKVYITPQPTRKWVRTTARSKANLAATEKSATRSSAMARLESQKGAETETTTATTQKRTTLASEARVRKPFAVTLEF